MTEKERVRMNYDEMAAYLGIPPRNPEREKIMAALTPADWDAYEHLRWAEEEIKAGRTPRGAIVCREHEEKRHPVFGRAKS